MRTSRQLTLDQTTDLRGKRILIIKLRYIGDTLSLVPVIDNLKGKAPDAIVDVLVNKGTEEVLAYHPGINSLLVYDRQSAKKNNIYSLFYTKQLISKLRSMKYDFVLDYTHGDRAAFLSFATGAAERISFQKSTRLSRLLMNRFIRSDPFRFHIVDYQLQALRYFGMDHFRRKMRIFVPEKTQSKIDGLLLASGLRHGAYFAVVHPGARGRLRQWRPERFGEISRRLKDTYGAAIILIGGQDEGELVDKVERQMGCAARLKTRQLDLLEMAALIRRAMFFLGNDSAPGHIAAATMTPNVTLFGPTFPHMWRPLSPVGEVVFKNVACCGCRQDTCIRPESHCMDLIEPDEVWEKVKAVIAGSPQFK